ncbi:helix-hairpin-helix domain-containing protein [Jiangella sp. DSM 45060]|uniref:helix-hairpin-helix domain-containing protein n=1 Tax=Jiangella sp. DSM 45060 TaxID=1798224 RepID=UPI000B857790|nr:helix-hairpin-helix domain-containing protein [Jiangella sp. DSM 45060]
MRSFRSRSVDDHTAALARARVAHVAGRPWAHGTAFADGAAPPPTLADDAALPPPALADDGTKPPPALADDDAGPALWAEPDDAPPLGARPAARRHPAPHSRSAVPFRQVGQPTDSASATTTAADPVPPWARPASASRRAAAPSDADPQPEHELEHTGDPPPPAEATSPARFWRLGLERIQLAVIVLVVLIGAIGAAVLFLLARPEVVPIEPELVATGTAQTAASDPPTNAPTTGDPPAVNPDDPPATGGPIVIHVAGLVARPGVVELPSGSRVVDAIEAAGGATPDADLTPINLARVLTDGEQVLVTADPPPAAPPVPPGGSAAAPTTQAPVNLNTATAAELEALPGIGPALAGRILDWREQNGRFTSIDELREVSGIGEQRFAQLEPLVTL